MSKDIADTWTKRELFILAKIRQGLFALVSVLIAGMVIYGVFRMCEAGYGFCYEIFGPVVVDEAPGEDKGFEVFEHESMEQVAERLASEGIIANRLTFYIRTRLMDSDEINLVPGKYTLNTSMDYEEIIDILTVSS